jgi:hypothetical protein
MRASTSESTKYIFTLVQERHYDSDLDPEEELGSVILDVDPQRVGQTESQLLDLIRATGALADEVDEDEIDLVSEDSDYRPVTYYIKSDRAIELDTIEEAALFFFANNSGIGPALTDDDDEEEEPSNDEQLDLSYEGTSFRTGDFLYAETPGFTAGRMNRYEFTLGVEEFAGWEEDELEMNSHDGIPLIDDYIRPDQVEVLKENEQRIDLGSVFLKPLAQVQPGDIVVFTAFKLGNLIAEVEAGPHTTWNPTRG